MIRKSVVLGVFALTMAASAAFGRGEMFYPVNAHMCRQLLADGAERLFVQDSEEPLLYHADGGWNAEIEGNRVLLMNDSEDPSLQRGYLFVNGLLRKMLVNGREMRVTTPPLPSNAEAEVKSFWPPAEERLKAATAPDDFWRDGERLKLWFRNPNLAGGFLALCAICALGLLYVRVWPVKALGALTALAILVPLVKTGSRAALLAFVGGCCLMAATRFKALLSRKVLLPVLACAVLVGGYLAFCGDSGRFTTKLFVEGSSKTSRFPIWREVPRMIADAPLGWGAGNSGKAYIRWYQREQTCLLEDLISGHCTFLAEHSWPIRFAYLFVWIVFGLLFFRNALLGRSPVPLGVAGALAFLGVLHPIFSSWELVSLASVVGLSAVAVWRDWRGVKKFALPSALTAAAVCFLIFAVGRWVPTGGGAVPIRGGSAAVCINGSEPATWIVDDDYALHGGYWWLLGKEIRDWCGEDPSSRSVGHAFSAKAVPACCRHLVLVGEAGESFCREWKDVVSGLEGLTDVTFLSPSFLVTDIPPELSARFKVHAVQGGLVARAAQYESRPDFLKVVPAAALYIPNWLDALHGELPAIGEAAVKE